MDTDSTKSNISRIYDYVLGGHHNLEVDRIAAQQILKVFPSYPRWARLNRWFLQMVATQWAQDGYRNIIDLGSGLPTQNHVHTLAPKARVLYTDNDPIAVAYAREVLGDNPSVVYHQADIRDPAPILAAADQLFQGDRRVAIGCIGIAYLIDDDRLGRLLRTLHEWAAPGSVMALSSLYFELNTQNIQATNEIFKRSGAEAFPRNEAAIRAIVRPWHVRELKPLASWLNIESQIQEADREGSNLDMLGALLDHESVS